MQVIQITKMLFMEKTSTGRLHAVNLVDAVSVAKARQPAFNGTHQKQGDTRNDKRWYKHEGGACILYDDDAKRWMLAMSEDSAGTVYSPQPRDDDDIGPPKGEWCGRNGEDSCSVKAEYLRVSVSNARQGSLNGTYTKQKDNYNERPWY